MKKFQRTVYTINYWAVVFRWKKLMLRKAKKKVVCNLVKFTDIESGFLGNIDQSDCLKPKIVQLYNRKLDQRGKNFKN